MSKSAEVIPSAESGQKSRKSARSGKSGKSNKSETKSKFFRSRNVEEGNRSSSRENDNMGAGDRTSKREIASEAGRSIKEKAESYNDTVVGIVVKWAINAIPLGMIVVGVLNLENCPIEPFIPIWMIAAGTMYILSTLVEIATYFKREKRHLAIRLVDALLCVAMFVWLIIGSVWVYSVYPKVDYSSKSTEFCDKTTYLFAIVVITFTYCLFILCCSCIMCVACCAFLTAGRR